VVDETIINVLTAQMCGTGGNLDFEDTLLNGRETDIVGSSTEIKKENIALASDETVGDG
jgi:hypothetical protein